MVNDYGYRDYYSTKHHENGSRSGHQAEERAATLPNMRKRHFTEKGKHDLVHIPSGARVEVKYSDTRPNNHDTYSPTIQFLWRAIVFGRFDWLLLIRKYQDLLFGKDPDEYFFWLEPPWSACWLLIGRKR